MCYETIHLQQSLDSLENAGLRIYTISNPKPAILFDNRNVSFYKIQGFGLIEILEK